MLVLSRRLNEKIVFPEFDTAVQVLAVKGNNVRIGIEAPQSVTVLRGELQAAAQKGPAPSPGADAETQLRQLKHMLRNRLNVASIGLTLLARQLQGGMLAEGQATLDKVHDDFELLRARLEAEHREQASPPAAKTSRARRALLVEDDQNERELLAGFLRLSGMQVDVAGDGCDALDYLRTRAHPDVVLLDMILPRCDGPTTVRNIRSDPANSKLKIIGVTGHSPESFQVEGVNRWFRKPLNLETLLHDLSEELECAGT